jgi:hypothetical protein
MDKKTFKALQEIVLFAQRTHDDVHPDAHYKAFKRVSAWMHEIEKEIEDIESLGTNGRPSLAPVK